ncbi:thiamine phosphate synthase [Terasakiella sp.]|uniref:thiamine phosphate synthase n=1 Tax=Terasakiella sp. TaxID=2034861 RepID=UPI003AA9DF81
MSKGVEMAVSVSEVARQLNRRNAKKKNLPALVFMTDAKRFPDPTNLIPRMPKNSALIVRHFSKKQKEQILIKIKRLCRKHKVKLLVSDDLHLALKHHLDGVHFPEKTVKKIAACGRFIRPKASFVVTGACHCLPALKRAEKAKLDGVLLSPVFATQSHPNAVCLGSVRFNAWASHTNRAVYGLGGINQKMAIRLSCSKSIGFAGIGGLI